MALDGAFLYAVKKELDFLTGSRIDKIHQPSKEEILITLRAQGEMQKLIISASANSARVHLTKAEVENPKTPPMFCMLLRKHLNGGKLTGIRQDGLERILFLDFEAMNEIGDLVRITLACEIMGRCSNIILINSDGRIIDSIKHVDEEMSRERLVLPGMKYTLPPRDERLSLLNASRDEMANRIRLAKNAELSKCLIKVFEGISPIFAREAVFYAAKGKEITLEEADDDTIDRLVFWLINARENLLAGKNTYTVVMDKENNLKDFCFVRISQYGPMMVTKELPGACETLDYFYAEREAANRAKQRSYDLLKFLANTSDRISRKIALQKEELAKCALREELKIKGDLISANIYALQKGQKSAKLLNFYADPPAEIEIELDPRLSPAQNAQKYYSEYRKAANAEKKLTELIASGEAEIIYLDSVFDALTRARSEDEILELRMELMEQGYIRSRLKTKPPKPQKPLEYVSSDGFLILAGRNNIQNDKLTLKTAKNNDIWLHTHDIAGSHVIIVTDGKNPPDRTIEEAAIIAACNSKARNSSQVPVDYTLVKYVKKPSGAKPGMVIFTNNKTAFVTPDMELANRLKRQG
ncbi:MAG: NFACT family protein [Oscillospiraceae bacterium]|nr:NFACT family protein [Oscillospiraceae bacterium]